MTLEETIKELRESNESESSSLRLPAESEVSAMESILGIKFSNDFKTYLLKASDIVFGYRAPATITNPDSHTFLPKIIESAKMYGLPSNMIPFCIDNLVFYCFSPSGEIVSWYPNGWQGDKWSSLLDWIEDVWLMNKEPYFAYSAGLRVMNAPHLHDEITRQTGINPTHSHKKEDIRHPKLINERWENDIWQLKSPLSKGAKLSEHLCWLKDKILPHSAYFKKLIKDGIEIDIFCGYRSDCDHAGLSVTPDALELFTVLGIKMELSIIIA